MDYKETHESFLSDDTVVLQEKSSPISDEQKWLRGEKDANDWFTFTNPKSGKVLTAYFSTDPRSLTIISIANCLYIPQIEF